MIQSRKNIFNSSLTVEKNKFEIKQKYAKKQKYSEKLEKNNRNKQKKALSKFIFKIIVT